MSSVVVQSPVLCFHSHQFNHKIKRSLKRFFFFKVPKYKTNTACNGLRGEGNGKACNFAVHLEDKVIIDWKNTARKKKFFLIEN